MKTLHVALVGLALTSFACKQQRPERSPVPADTRTGSATDELGEAKVAAATKESAAGAGLAEATKEAEAPGEQALTVLSNTKMTELLTAVGCPKDARSPMGCEVCPSKLNPTANPSLDRPYAPGLAWKTPSVVSFTSASKRKAHAFSAAFAHRGADHLLVYGGCSLKGDEEEHMRPNRLYLTKSGELVGVLEGYKHDTALESCAFPKDASSKASVLCIESRGRMGVMSLSFLRIHTPTTETEDLNPNLRGLEYDEMPDLGEVEGTFTGEDGDGDLVMPDSFRLVFEGVRDVDSDGDEDVLVTSGKDSKWVLIQGQGGTFVAERAK